MTTTTPTWQSRELSRFADGTYKSVPVTLDYPADHFLHLSVTESEGDTVAYTPSPEYGQRDRQVRLKFGRYLKKTFDALTDAEIQAYVTVLKSALSIEISAPVLKFATDRYTITRIFETRMYACGSNTESCMYNKFTGDTRPYHVYADSPDVAVAYVLSDGAIISRSVVSTKDSVWVRCYSAASGDNDTDCGTLRKLLSDAGYSEGDLYGNRLTKLATDSVMLPYIDNSGAHVEDAGRYWRVVEDGGDYECDCTDGSATSLVDKCSQCENDEDDCECIYCDCCEERYADGCERCSMCESCDNCTVHGGCDCSRCSECRHLISGRSWMATCNCDRCSECYELTDDCECSEDEDENEDGDSEDGSEDAPVVKPVEVTLTTDEVRHKLNRIWRYLVYERGIVPDEDAKRIIKAAFDGVTAEMGVAA